MTDSFGDKLNGYLLTVPQCSFSSTKNTQPGPNKSTKRIQQFVVRESSILKTTNTKIPDIMLLQF